MALLGMNAKLYRTSAPVTVSDPSAFTGTEVLGVVDVSVESTVLASFDTTAREDAFATSDRGKPRVALSVTIENRPEAAGDISHFLSAFVNSTPVGLAAFDRAISSASRVGVAGNFKVHAAPRSEPLNDRQVYTFTMEPHSLIGFKAS